MANSQVLLADLKAGRCSNVAEVRLLRFWEAKNVRKGGELMSVDMLFVDENSTLTQGSVGANRHLRFRDRLTKGSLYTLTGFDVTRSNTNFRLTDAPFSIRFNEGTELEKIPTSVRHIPTELFRFMPYTQILELANTGKQLPDSNHFACRNPHPKWSTQSPRRHPYTSPLCRRPSCLSEPQPPPANRSSTSHVHQAHYIRGIHEYFEKNNIDVGLHHIRIAAEGSYDNTVYLYGVIMLSTGHPTIGEEMLNSLQWRVNSKQRTLLEKDQKINP
ncbi:hypothetical protein Bca52824_042014 [Brassica carinata]|uniref:DUF223 domain-containing protein n=1 Tax=Brassica carinata TaxID=52824 RepID=A0A8X7RYC8_BRACI|nr:hypothetical protein Bca52824_042014 [Brassica carinata]